MVESNAAESLGSHRERPALIIRQADPTTAKLLAKDTILREQILD